MYGYTQTIGKQESCVAGGVKTGIPDTHTQIVWSTYGHTQTKDKHETCVAGGIKTVILDTHK